MDISYAQDSIAPADNCRWITSLLCIHAAVMYMLSTHSWKKFGFGSIQHDALFIHIDLYGIQLKSTHYFSPPKLKCDNVK